jgi:replicative DNA helicase Mcm
MAAVQPAMAHQRITLAKDGVNWTFEARVSVIASANPLLGRYNPYQTIVQNISLSIPLLSCFDLIFIIRDIPETSRDRRTAEHILFSERRLELFGGIIPPIRPQNIHRIRPRTETKAISGCSAVPDELLCGYEASIP